MGLDSALSELLRTLSLEHFAAPLEDEAVEDIALLKSMGPEGLEENLCGEMGLDAGGVAALSRALFGGGEDDDDDTLALEENDSDEGELALEENNSDEGELTLEANDDAAKEQPEAHEDEDELLLEENEAAGTPDAAARAAAQKYKAQGNAALEAGMAQEAAELYSRAIELDATDGVFYSNRSAARARLRRFADALRDAETAAELKPGWAKAHARQAAALSGLGEHERAAAAYARALELAPDTADVLNNYGFFEERRGNLEAARDAYARARDLLLPHSHPQIDFNLRSVEARLQQQGAG